MAPTQEISPSDAAFIIDSIQRVTTPIVINAGEIAKSKNAKLNTVQKRFNELKKRYKLNIVTTSIDSGVPVASSSKAAGTASSGFRVTKKQQATTTKGKNLNKTSASPARMAALTNLLDNDDNDNDDYDSLVFSPSLTSKQAIKAEAQSSSPVVKLEVLDESEGTNNHDDTDLADVPRHGSDASAADGVDTDTEQDDRVTPTA